MRIVRLGQGVDRTGRLAPEALERTRVALAEYAARHRELGAERVRMVATSATRDADNRDDFVAGGAARRSACEPEVVTGAEEAALSFAGATARAAGGAAGRAAVPVVDIGGGSTEFVLGDATASRAARSVDVGCVRLTERHLHSDPPTAGAGRGRRGRLDAALDAGAADGAAAARPRTLVGLAGTVTTVAALALGLAAYDPDAHPPRPDLGRGRSRGRPRRLLAATARRAGGAAGHAPRPGRRDRRRRAGPAGCIDAGRRSSEVSVSEHDILDGIALRLARGPAGGPG